MKVDFRTENRLSCYQVGNDIDEKRQQQPQETADERLEEKTVPGKADITETDFLSFHQKENNDRNYPLNHNIKNGLLHAVGN